MKNVAEGRLRYFRQLKSCPKMGQFGAEQPKGCHKRGSVEDGSAQVMSPCFAASSTCGSKAGCCHKFFIAGEWEMECSSSSNHYLPQLQSSAPNSQNSAPESTNPTTVSLTCPVEISTKSAIFFFFSLLCPSLSMNAVLT